MKVVMLPGMDGTGNLFSGFLSVFNEDTTVVSLPDVDNQRYEHLAELIDVQLPNEKFILLAESFSGGIVPHLLSRNKNVYGVIFVASFLSPPKKLILRLARHLPLKSLADFPGAGYWHRFLLLGFAAPISLLALFKQTIAGLPSILLKIRLKTMLNLTPPSGQSYSIPCAYIQPTNDKLVPKSKAVEICTIFTSTRVYSVAGPHFILQANPVESSLAIKQAIKQIVNATKYSTGDCGE